MIPAPRFLPRQILACSFSRPDIRFPILESEYTMNGPGDASAGSGENWAPTLSLYDTVIVLY